MKINNPIDPESLWLVSVSRMPDFHYFDSEEDARVFAKKQVRPCEVEAPVAGEQKNG